MPTEQAEPQTRGNGRIAGERREQAEIGAEQREKQTSEEERARASVQAVRSLASHFADLTREVTALVRDEAALARAEISEDLGRLKTGGTAAAVGAALGYAGLLILLGAAVAALALIWPLWLAALVVGGTAVIIGGIAAIVARMATKPEHLKPERTMESARSIGHTTKEALR